MPIPGANAKTVVLLSEVHIQCALIETSVARLEEASKHWIALSISLDFGRKFPPIEILSWCTSTLAAMAAIRRLLLEGGTKPSAKTKRRRAALFTLLGEPPLPQISSSLVRNDWEHLDERLDDFLPDTNHGSVSNLHVNTRLPAVGVYALRRFDPVSLEIAFLDRRISLHAARDEARELVSRVDAAMERLHTEIIDPWQPATAGKNRSAGA